MITDLLKILEKLHGLISAVLPDFREVLSREDPGSVFDYKFSSRSLKEVLTGGHVLRRLLLTVSVEDLTHPLHSSFLLHSVIKCK